MTRNGALNHLARRHVDSRRARPPTFFFVAAAVATAACIWARSARASGYLNPRLADPHGHPALANPYAIYFNPAALGGMHGTQIVVDGTLAWRTVDVTRNASALSPYSPGTLGDATYVAANTGDAHASNMVGLPFIAASSDFGQRNLFAGMGAYVPFGGVVKFDRRAAFAPNDTAYGAIDGPQRWALVSGVQQALFTTAAAGLRLPDERLSFALSGSVVLSSIVHNQARNLAGNDDITTEGRALIDVSGVEGSMTAGVYWEPLPEIRLGASYAVRPAFGETRLSGTLRQHAPGAYDSNKEVDMLLTYPDVIRAGVAAMPFGPSVELRLDAQYVLWSAFKRQCVVNRGQDCNIAADGSEVGTNAPQVILALTRKWKNAGGVNAGLGYFLDEKTELYGGVGFDTSSVHKANLEPTYPDAFKLIGSLGARRVVADGIVLGASYTYVGYLSVDSGHQNSFGQAGASRAPNEDGTYASRVMFFNINSAFTF